MRSLVCIFKALADEGRLQVLNLLLSHDLCVGGLARELGMSEPAVSQHLKKLRECGLVTGEKRGYWTHYSVNTDVLLETADALRKLTEIKRLEIGSCSRDSSECHCYCSQSSTDKDILKDFRIINSAESDHD